MLPRLYFFSLSIMAVSSRIATLLNGLIKNNGKPDDMNEEIMLRLVLTFILYYFGSLSCVLSLCGVMEAEEWNEDFFCGLFFHDFVLQEMSKKYTTFNCHMQ